MALQGLQMTVPRRDTAATLPLPCPVATNLSPQSAVTLLPVTMDSVAKRMPEMAAAMQPNIQRKMNDAKRQLRNAAEKIVAQELAEYRSAFDDGDEDGEHSEEG